MDVVFDRSEGIFSSSEDVHDDDVTRSSSVSASSSPPTAATPPRKLYHSKSTNLPVENIDDIGSYIASNERLVRVISLFNLVTSRFQNRLSCARRRTIWRVRRAIVRMVVRLVAVWTEKARLLWIIRYLCTVM